MFTQEQLEEFIKNTREAIESTKIALVANPNNEDMQSMLKTLETSLNGYMEQLESINKVGRPAIGITKKVSLTLSEENWKWLDKQANGNRSKFLREIVWNALGNENEWSNYAGLGYAIAGAKKLGYDDEQISELVREIQWQFDMKSVPEAEDIYRESDY